MAQVLRTAFALLHQRMVGNNIYNKKKNAQREIAQVAPSISDPPFDPFSTGATGVVTLIRRGQVIVGNVGACRAVVGRTLPANEAEGLAREARGIYGVISQAAHTKGHGARGSSSPAGDAAGTQGSDVDGGGSISLEQVRAMEQSGSGTSAQSPLGSRRQRRPSILNGGPVPVPALDAHGSVLASAPLDPTTGIAGASSDVNQLVLSSAFTGSGILAASHQLVSVHKATSGFGAAASLRIKQMQASVPTVDFRRNLPKSSEEEETRAWLKTHSFPAFPDIPRVIEGVLRYPDDTYVKPSRAMQDYRAFLVESKKAEDQGLLQAFANRIATIAGPATRHRRLDEFEREQAERDKAEEALRLHKRERHLTWNSHSQGSSSHGAGATATGQNLKSAANQLLSGPKNWSPVAGEGDRAPLPDAYTQRRALESATAGDGSLQAYRHTVVSEGLQRSQDLLKKLRVNSGARLVPTAVGVDFARPPTGFDAGPLGKAVYRKYHLLHRVQDASSAAVAVGDRQDQEAGAKHNLPPLSSLRHPHIFLERQVGSSNFSAGDDSANVDFIAKERERSLEAKKHQFISQSRAAQTIASDSRGSIQKTKGGVVYIPTYEEDPSFYDASGRPVRLTVPVALSVDHRPDRPDELIRISTGGGKVQTGVFADGTKGTLPRVYTGSMDGPGLTVSRCLGFESAAKAGVIADPEVMVHTIEPQDRFLVLASDGIWSVMSAEEAVYVVGRALDSALWGGSGATEQNGPTETDEEDSGNYEISLPVHSSTQTTASCPKASKKAPSRRLTLAVEEEEREENDKEAKIKRSLGFSTSAAGNESNDDGLGHSSRSRRGSRVKAEPLYFISSMGSAAKATQSIAIRDRSAFTGRPMDAPPTSSFGNPVKILQNWGNGRTSRAKSVCSDGDGDACVNGMDNRSVARTESSESDASSVISDVTGLADGERTNQSSVSQSEGKRARRSRRRKKEASAKQVRRDSILEFAPEVDSRTIALLTALETLDPTSHALNKPVQPTPAHPRPLDHSSADPSQEVRISVAAGAAPVAGCGGSSATALDLLDSFYPEKTRKYRVKRRRKAALVASEALVAAARARWHALTHTKAAETLLPKLGPVGPQLLSAYRSPHDDISAMVIMFDDFR
jgi:serine/threonine protein phosphatase PrpC